MRKKPVEVHFHKTEYFLGSLFSYFNSLKKPNIFFEKGRLKLKLEKGRLKLNGKKPVEVGKRPVAVRKRPFEVEQTVYFFQNSKNYSIDSNIM